MQAEETLIEDNTDQLRKFQSQQLFNLNHRAIGDRSEGIETSIELRGKRIHQSSLLWESIGYRKFP